MNYKKLIAIILCLVFAFSALAACSDPEIEYPYDPDNVIPEDDGFNEPDIDFNHNHDSQGYIDFQAAMAAFPPNTVMVRAGDLELTWAELFVFLFRTTNDLLSYGVPINWSDPFELDDTLADVVLRFSTDEAISFLSFEYGANAINFQLSDEDNERFNTDLEGLIESYNGKDALEASLNENSGFYNFELFEKLFLAEYIINLLISELYGTEASDFPDEKVAVFAQEHNFMMAMHILRLKTDDADADPFGEAEDILKQLNDKVGSRNFDEFFKELMNEHSEDGGLMSYPNGYLFLHGDMVPEFSDAAAALDIGEISDIVETTYGYHIIMRIPIDYDVIPSGFSREGIMRTLRQVAALEDFDSIQEEWLREMTAILEFTPEFHSIDLATIFKLHDEDCDH